jgi:hypothetical protein
LGRRELELAILGGEIPTVVSSFPLPAHFTTKNFGISGPVRLFLHRAIFSNPGYGFLTSGALQRKAGSSNEVADASENYSR